MSDIKEIFQNKFMLLTIVNTLIVAAILILNYIFLREVSNIFITINIVAVIMLVLPFVVLKYLEYNKVKVMEETFPNFLRDFVESVRGGMTIKDSMKSLARNDYKELSPLVNKMAAQLDWGIPVETVLTNFGKSTNSSFIIRIISSVVESHKFGGNLTDTLEALGDVSSSVEKLKAERGNYLYSQIITGYVIFFGFLLVVVGIGKFLLPVLTKYNLSGVETSEAVQSALLKDYSDLFRGLILVQGFFAGISVGKMAEGAMISGIKHSLIMIFIGMLAFSLSGL